MLQHRFRIDREPNGQPAQQRWRARSTNGGGCSEFVILVDFEAHAVELDGQRLAFELRGTNLSRDFNGDAENGSVSADGPFRTEPEGSWTVLEVFMPGEEEPSFDLGLNATYGQGLLVVRRHLDRSMLLTRIFGPLTQKAMGNKELQIMTRFSDRTLLI